VTRHLENQVQYVRSKLFDFILVLWTLLLSPSLPVLWLLGTPRRYLWMVANVWANGVLLGLWYVVGLRYAELGKENFPDEPCIIIANHQSPWETLAFAVFFRNAAFVTKQEMAQVPIVGWFLTNYPMIMIDRKRGRHAIERMLAESRATLAEGRSVIIFPEGTRKSVSDQVILKRGVEFLYVELERPVLPVAVNSGVFWGPDRMLKYSGLISVSYLPPIMPGLSGSAFLEKVESVLQAEKERLVSQLNVEPWLDALG
jgi:1-acyl-sn-glycerol-3-phosphate acyltransferase